MRDRCGTNPKGGAKGLISRLSADGRLSLALGTLLIAGVAAFMLLVGTGVVHIEHASSDAQVSQSQMAETDGKASGKTDGKTDGADSKASDDAQAKTYTVTAHGAYKGLKAGTKYRMFAKLVDADGNAKTETVTRDFVASKSDGEVVVDFTVDKSTFKDVDAGKVTLDAVTYPASEIDGAKKN